MTRKNAFVVYAGPSETGRVFHALTHARQSHERGDATEIYFAAEGTYWPGGLADANNAMHPLFDELLQASVIQGACENCATAFGHADAAKASCGLVRGPEASYGQIDILGLEEAGWHVWLF